MFLGGKSYMPIYEYQCGHCGYAFEKLQRIGATLLTVCPQCQQRALKKLLSAPRFKLKGSGWYETDFKNKKSPTKETPTNKESKVGNTAAKSNDANTTLTKSNTTDN